MLKIAFIEDSPLQLKILQESIHFRSDIQCLLAVESVENFWEALPQRTTLDVIFVDIDLPGQSGVEAVPSLRKRFPEAEIVMLTQLEDSKLLLQTFQGGGTGYLLKNFPLAELPLFITTLMKGGALISPQMARHLINYFQPKHAATDTLTAKELQLLQLFSDGYSYQETAGFFNISIDGVKYHVKKIYSKLNVNNKVDAIRAIKSNI